MNPLERAWWRYRGWILHPRDRYAWHRKWRNRPDVGDVVVDCRGRLCTVVSTGSPEDPDYLVFDDGVNASWMHCCGWPEDPLTEAAGKGAPSILLGTSTRSLRKALRKLRGIQKEVEDGIRAESQGDDPDHPSGERS